MSHSELFARCARALRLASFAEQRGLSTREALDLEAAAAQRAEVSRRSFLRTAAVAAGGVAAIPSLGLARPPRGGAAPRIAIVGGGLAGLACADSLRAAGLSATIYEAAGRVGGRCFSNRTTFPGQVAENGGEFIDTTHHAMRSYAVEFGLAREDVRRNEGEVLYRFFGQTFTDEQVVEEYRRLVPRVRRDLQTLSGEPTFFDHTAADAALDNLSLADWLATRAADLPLVRAVLDEAYVAEYGLETVRQSCLNMLLFLHADRRRRFTPFGVFSDERFHLVGGNDAIATNIAARLPGPIVLGARLEGLSRNGGDFVLHFAGGGTERADFVVLTLPFSVLRGLNLHSSLGLGADKRRAINELGYGTNAKTMISFAGRPWLAAGGNGSAYSDLPNVQTTWETNASLAGARAILTDYAGGDRGANLNAMPVPAQVAAFLTDLEQLFPGAQAAAGAAAVNGAYVAHREHWPSNPLALGGYTCYEPGQFTSIAGLEGEAAGRLKFAGEHTDSFYSWQGFMEGACLSGFRAADEILDDLRANR